MPTRTCIVCRSSGDKRSLVRIARSDDGSVAVDEMGKGPGRGAYLCRRRACWTSAALGRQLGRALRTTVAAADMAALQAYGAAMPEGAPEPTT